MPDLKKIIKKTLRIHPVHMVKIKKKRIKKPKRPTGPGPKKQVLRKKPAKAKRKSPK